MTELQRTKAADEPRADVGATLDRLRAVGITRIVMLTGDNRTTANAIARRLGLTEVEADVLPRVARTRPGVDVLPQQRDLQHALIHDDIPRITNTGVRLDADGEPSFFHPGDALDAEPGQVDVLAFPLQAPWQRSRDMTAFLRRHAAPHAVPVHDGLLLPRGRDLYLTQAGRLGSSQTRIHDLAGAGPTEFRSGV